MDKHGLDFCVGAELTIIRSKRKTIAIQIKGNHIIVRAPMGLRNADIIAFLRSKRVWIEKHYAIATERQEAAKSITPYTAEEIHALA